MSPRRRPDDDSSVTAARWLRRVLAAGVVALASLGGMRDMAAQTPPPKDTSETTLSDDDKAALALLRDDKMLTARTRAEELLNKDPNSIVGHFVMGTALREAEGALARALAHFKRARELYETRYGTDEAEDGRPWRVYADTLFAIAITTQLMEDFEGSLRAMDDYDERFSPKMLSQRVWPLMKLGRFNEARAYAQRALDSGSVFQKVRALNGLCAVEGEEQHRQGNYEACMAVYKFAKQRQDESKETDPARRPQVVVYANNAHLGALSVLRYDEAEQLAIDGTKSVEETSTNPWLRLARIYLDQGRAAEAVTATKAVEGWAAHQPPSTREQFRSEDEGTVAILLLVAGEAKAAQKLADRILERPDRRAMTSTKPEQTAGANALLRRAILRLGADLAAERASYSGWKQMPGHLADSARLSAAMWPDAQRVVGALLDEHTLISTLRVYLDGGIEYVPTWLVGELVEILGPGVFLAALSQARERELVNPTLGFAAFFDGLEAEARLAQGDEGLALVLARRSLAALPKAEVLFKARVAAVAAEAARRSGDLTAALALFEQAMQGDPGVIRRLGLRLPVTVQATSGGALASETASLLRHSPRLDDVSGGFPLSVREAGGHLEVCLRTTLGAELACTATPVAQPEPKPAKPAPSATPATSDKPAPADDEAPPPLEPPQRAAEAFHKSVFALKMNLSDGDIRSLDGGNTATRDAARDRMRELLHDDPAPPEEPPPTPPEK